MWLLDVIIIINFLINYYHSCYIYVSNNEIMFPYQEKCIVHAPFVLFCAIYFKNNITGTQCIYFLTDYYYFTDTESESVNFFADS
jgi:hypothetical protein